MTDTAPTAHIGGMTAFNSVPLKDMDPSALSLALLDTVAGIPAIDSDTVARAAAAASYLHMNQRRANRGHFTTTAYIEHPLRNALRALRWGVVREPVITGILLHDTVEDCLDRIQDAYIPGRRDHLSVQDQRDRAFGWISHTFGDDAAALVRALTNPLPTGESLTAEQKRVRYAAHVASAIRGDADAFIGKFSDFMDNAGGLHHNLVPGREQMVERLAAKYLPVVAVFEHEMDTNGGAIRGLVSEHGWDEINTKIGALHGRLEGLVEQTQAA